MAAASLESFVAEVRQPFKDLALEFESVLGELHVTAGSLDDGMNKELRAVKTQVTKFTEAAVNQSLARLILETSKPLQDASAKFDSLLGESSVTLRNDLLSVLGEAAKKTKEAVEKSLSEASKPLTKVAEELTSLLGEFNETAGSLKEQMLGNITQTLESFRRNALSTLKDFDAAAVSPKSTDKSS